ncbi:NADH:ubiquinone reductase (Na(+)-transporting) subunit C [Sulfidibacter corallicola]|uniref:Na(+)-translocating NADH-quinone reductase subunit C n=1 Tax=Sulfidibacter corallicola TaxID=2818388 RepID=A0A8A4TT88_SULCO|nr:NADH:ubiquinone reductase (Na(+)-transporting) subunit C [Sulfidibacter corallicola]QTD53169.1 NADH:ubiquinone reductase (Na(+)-transporting) subunit C [Sulfidibacter corallicola]
MSQAKQGAAYTYMFAMGLCLVCSIGLSLAYTYLKPIQADNVRLDIVQNLLTSVGYTQDQLTKMAPDEVLGVFEKDFQVQILNKDNKEAQRDFMESELLGLGYPQETLTGMDKGSLMNLFNTKVRLLARKAGKKPDDYDPGYKALYIYQPGGKVEAYVIPIMGNGLWDIIKGYIALDLDLNTVKGISFYEHAETPGLGARITEDWFKQNYVGKHILDNGGDLISITIAKGKVVETVPDRLHDHYVDGISGATLTGKGINDFLKSDLSKYEPYFKTLRN